MALLSLKYTSPCFFRTGHVLNVFWEKTPENVFYEALVASCAKLGLTLVDYTTTEDIAMVPIAGRCMELCVIFKDSNYPLQTSHIMRLLSSLNSQRTRTM